MPRVQCPVCANSVIVTTRLGHTFQVSGVFEPSICLVLKEREEIVRDPMECSTLEAAVEKMIEDSKKT